MHLLPALLLHVPLKYPVPQFKDSEEQTVTNNSPPLVPRSLAVAVMSPWSPAGWPVPHRQLLLSLCPLHTITVTNSKTPAQLGDSWKSQGRFSKLKKREGIATYYYYYCHFSFQSMNPVKVPGKAECISDSQGLSIPAGQMTDPQQELWRIFVDNPNTVFEKMQGWKT